MKYFLPLLVLALSQVAFIQAAYTVVDPADYDSNSQIQDSLNYGGEYIIQLGIGRNVLPEDNYQVAQINQIEQDVLANGADYRFNVNIASDEGVKVAALYTVYYRFSTNAMKVVSYQYNYTYPNDLKNSTEEFSWEDYDFNPTETETETEGGEGEGECPGETEFPGENEWPGEGECPGEEEEWTCPGEEEGTTPGEEEGTNPGEEEGTNPGEEEGNIPGEEEGNLPGEEEWVCEEAEGPLAGWPNEWVEIIEESN